MVYMTNCPTCGYNGVDGDQCPYCGNQEETDVNTDFSFPRELLGYGKSEEVKFHCHLCGSGEVSAYIFCAFCSFVDNPFPDIHSTFYNTYVVKIKYSVKLHKKAIRFIIDSKDYFYDYENALDTFKKYFKGTEKGVLEIYNCLKDEEYKIKESKALVLLFFRILRYWMPKIVSNDYINIDDLAIEKNIKYLSSSSSRERFLY